jgi:hypothetical protein
VAFLDAEYSAILSSVSTGSADERAWHQALAYALLGRRFPALARQSQPDLAGLILDLEREGRAVDEPLADAVTTARARAARWPYAVPGDLMRGLGAAQFTATLSELIRHLEIVAGPERIAGPRPPDAGERRLLRDVPPHHGS